MPRKVNVQQFLNDYCDAVPDKEIFVKHGISAKEMLQLVRRLINQGLLTKEQYFERNKKIQELELEQEKSFLASLYHCTTCGHVHPKPFTVCPACGASTDKKDIAEPSPPKRSAPPVSHEPPPVPEAAPPVTHEPPPVPEAAPPEPAQQVQVHIAPTEEQAFGTPTTLQDTFTGEAPTLTGNVKRSDFPPELSQKIGVQLEEVWFVPDLAPMYENDTWIITEILAETPKAATFKAESDSGDGPPIAVKLFKSEIAPEEDIDVVLDQIVEYQSNMSDANVVAMLGTAMIDWEKALLYEYMPLDLETALQQNPSGLEIETLRHLLPQLLNGLGYCHMHRGRDDMVRRLPHYNLKPSKILLDLDMEVAKLDDPGVVRSIIDGWTEKRFLWQEPGSDLTALAPECFVFSSRLLNGRLVDIYAMGVVLYKAVTGRSPFTEMRFEDYKLAHLKKFVVPPRVHRYDIPRWLDHMILKCFEKEPEERWRSPTQMELEIGKDTK